MEESVTLHALLMSRLTVAQKFCKKPHESWKSWIKEYEIDDVSDTAEIRDKVRIGYIFRKIETDQPAIFDDQPDIFIKGRHANTKDVEPLIEGVYDFLWDVQNLEQKIEDMGPYFSLLGMAFIESPWVTKTKKVTQMMSQPVMDEMGQPVIDPATGQPQMQEVEQELEVPVYDCPCAEVGDPFKYYFSPETIFAPVMDYEHCPYYFRERVMTKDEIKSRYNKKVEAGETIKTGITEVDNSDEDAKVVKDDIKRVTTYEYYGCLPKEQARAIKNVKWEYDKEYHIIVTKKEVILAEECQYPSKPLFPIANYGLANKFWKFGEAKHLMPLVEELEVYRSQLLGYTRKMATPKPLVSEGTVTDMDAFNDPNPGRPVLYSGNQPPTYLSPSQLGKEVEAGITMAREDLEKTSGSFDLAGGSDQSTVKSPRGIQVYSEAADKGIRRKRKKFARLIRDIIMFQFQQLAQNWKPEDNKTISIVTGEGPQATQVTAEVLEVLAGVGEMYALDVEIESLSVNRVQMRQDALDLWDLAKEAPDVFNRDEIAKWMLQSGFNMKDGDRFLLTPEQKAAMVKNQQEKPKVNISVRADAGTPAGAAILETEGVLPQGMGQQMASQTQQQQLAAAQVAPVQQQLGGGFNG